MFNSKNLRTLNRVGASRRKLTTLTLVAANLLLPAAESAAQSSPRSSAKNYAAHLEALKEKDMAAFQKRWEEWVMKLTFP